MSGHRSAAESWDVVRQALELLGSATGHRRRRRLVRPDNPPQSQWIVRGRQGYSRSVEMIKQSALSVPESLGCSPSGRAEGEGFEPSIGLPIAVFKTVSHLAAAPSKLPSLLASVADQQACNGPRAPCVPDADAKRPPIGAAFAQPNCGQTTSCAPVASRVAYRVLSTSRSRHAQIRALVDRDPAVGGEVVPGPRSAAADRRADRLAIALPKDTTASASRAAWEVLHETH